MTMMAESGIRNLQSSSRQWTNPKRAVVQAAQHARNSYATVSVQPVISAVASPYHPRTQSEFRVRGQDIIRNVAVARCHKNRSNLQCFISQRSYAVVLVGTPAVVWRSPHQLLLPVRPNPKWHGWTSRDRGFQQWRGW